GGGEPGGSRNAGEADASHSPSRFWNRRRARSVFGNRGGSGKSVGMTSLASAPSARRLRKRRRTSSGSSGEPAMARSSGSTSARSKRWTKSGASRPRRSRRAIGAPAVEESAVRGAVGNQLLVGPLLHDTARFEDDDDVGVAHGGQPVGDDQRGSPCLQ